MAIEDLLGDAVGEPYQMFARLGSATLTLRFRVLTLRGADTDRAWHNLVHLEGVEVNVAVSVQHAVTPLQRYLRWLLECLAP
jgi:hypothetical protein